MTFEAIARELGIKAPSVHALVMRALQEDADVIEARRPELRALEQRRLDDAAQALWPRVKEGDARAQDTWLRNRQRYAALLGLDLKPPDVTVDASQNVIVLPAWGEQPAQVDGEARELPAETPDAG